MPIYVDVRNASGSDQLTKGCTFYWDNPTGNDVQLGSCGGFCTKSSFLVLANDKAIAHILPNPPGPFGFTDTGWNAPGSPRISAPKVPARAKKSRKRAA